MRHLQTGPFESTLGVKPLIRLAAVQDTLVTAYPLRHLIQGLDDPQPQFFPLLIFGHCDVFDVADPTKIVDEFVFDEDGSCADDSGGIVEHDQDIVGVVVAEEVVVAGIEGGFGGFANGSEDAKRRKEALFRPLSEMDILMLLVAACLLVVGRNQGERRKTSLF